MKVRWTTCAFVLLVLFSGIAVCGDIEPEQLYAKEKGVFEAADEVMKTLIAVSGRNLPCQDCVAIFKDVLQEATVARKKHRDDIAAAMALSHRGRRPVRMNSALETEKIYAGLLARIPDPTGSLCGACVPASGDARMDALKKEFGSRGGPTVNDSMAEALVRLHKAASVLQRRFYDPTFGKRLENVFAEWIAQPTEENLQLASDCIEGMMTSLILKNSNPAVHLRDAATFPKRHIRDFYNKEKPVAFVYFDSEEEDDLIFICPSFFGEPDKWGIIVHEEAHLLYDATDKGRRHVQRSGTKPPRYRGKAAIRDAYAIVSLIGRLNRM